jgi:hypothetical protein
MSLGKAFSTGKFRQQLLLADAQPEGAARQVIRFIVVGRGLNDRLLMVRRGGHTTLDRSGRSADLCGQTLPASDAALTEVSQLANVMGQSLRSQ